MKAKELRSGLDPKFAQSLVDIVAAELNKNVNITDHHGVIIASFSKDRITQVHECAAFMLASGKAHEFSVSEEDEKQHPGVRKGFNVPIMFGDRCMGVIGVTGDPELAAPYARLAARFVGAALESNARKEELVNALKEKEELHSMFLSKIIAVQEEERKRISRELHDETSQALTSIIVALRVSSDRLQGTGEREQILQIRDLVVTTLEAVHRLAVDLRPMLLDDLGLVVATQKYVESYTKQYGIPVDVHFANLSRQRFTPEIEISLYRILQEALTNIAKHARASYVQIKLWKFRGKLSLRIIDAGQGFDTGILNNACRDRCLGIYGMQERVALLRGSFSIESELGKGTSITVQLPMSKNSKNDT